MRTPILDPRDLNAIMAEIAAHAAQYTPEWRYEDASDDPGAAIARLFGEMFYQTVDRFNSVPEKLYIEFLEQIGVQMPDPVPAQGMVQFEPHDTVTDPVPVPKGTQIYRGVEDGDGIVYETVRPIEATAARLKHVFFSDTRRGILQELDLARPQFFFSENYGENLTCHRFSVEERDALCFSCPGTVELQVLAENRFTAEETAQLLAGPNMVWTWRRGEEDVPFDSVELSGDRILLKRLSPSDGGDLGVSVSCAGNGVEGTIRVDGIRAASQSLDWVDADELASGDVALDPVEGGYCFGRRPTGYNTFYIRSDQAFRKRGARAAVKLELVPIVTEPVSTAPTYNFTERLIDKKAAVEVKPDDVFVDEVIWEYYNGSGWAKLEVTGNRNPFSCKDSGSLETVFTVPEDIARSEVNAREGYYIRARVLHVENEMSQIPRWIVPFVKCARCKWHYDALRPVTRYFSVNNGTQVELEESGDVRSVSFPAIVAPPREPAAMYFCFDASPHAMPLTMYFDLAGKAPMDDKLTFEAWNGKRFEPVNTLDQTRNLLSSGLVFLYLPQPLPGRELFGREGCWLRAVRSTYRENGGGYPRVSGVHLNTVSAVQSKQEESMVFDTDVYEANKTLELLESPVLNCGVWVDEARDLALAEAKELAEKLPGKVRLEFDDGVLQRCWIRWERTGHLELCSGEERVYQLEPYSGRITFGDGIHGRVPAVGQRNIYVSYASGGGVSGNCPAGEVRELMGSLPRINSVVNLTDMSGGTDRFSPEKVRQLGNKRLRHRGRAVSARDFEEMVAEAFPQVTHVKCFARRDPNYTPASGHVTVVVDSCSSGAMTADLCDRIYTYLEPRCDCTMTQSRRLHVIPATILTVNTEVSVEVEDMDQAAITQQLLDQRLRQLVDDQWRKRDIGDQVRVDQLWQVVRDTPNVRLVRKVLVEGVYDENGITRSIPLETDKMVPYASVRSGKHRIRLG